MTDRVQHEIPCAEVVVVLWDYLDEELDAHRRDAVRRHLAECDHCSEHFTFQGAFLRAVANVIDEPIDIVSLRARVVEALEAEGFATHGPWA